MHLLLRAMQVMFEIDEFVGICIDGGVVHGHVLLRGNLVFDFVEEHDDHVFATAVILEQPCRYIDERGSLAARKAHAPRHYAITVAQYAMQRGPQLRAQLWVDEREQIARRLTADILQETSGVIGHMQDRAITIHGDVRRRIALEYALTQRRQRRWRLVPQTGPPGDVEGRGADQRQRRHSARTNPFRLVNAVALVHLFEQVARDLDRFRAAEKQKTARPQRKVKRLQHLALYGFIEVDQQVAARDQVHSRKRRITQDVVDGEHHFLTQFLAHLVTATGLHKKSAQPFRRYVRHYRSSIDARTRRLDRTRVDIRGKHLDQRKFTEGRPVLAQQHRQRVRLLAGRAPRRPGTHRLIERAHCEEVRHHLLLQGIE